MARHIGCSSRGTGPLRCGERAALVSEEVLEPRRCHFGVPHGVLDVLVAEVVLYRPRVVPVIGQLEPASVPQHVRVCREAEARRLARSLHHLPHVVRCHRPTALAGEDVARVVVCSRCSRRSARRRQG
jgi:hypothetical protein